LERSQSALRRWLYSALISSASQSEQILGMSSFAFAALVIAAGVLAYVLNQALKPAGWAVVQGPEPVG